MVDTRDIPLGPSYQPLSKEDKVRRQFPESVTVSSRAVYNMNPNLTAQNAEANGGPPTGAKAGVDTKTKEMYLWLTSHETDFDVAIHESDSGKTSTFSWAEALKKLKIKIKKGYKAVMDAEVVVDPVKGPCLIIKGQSRKLVATMDEDELKAAQAAAEARKAARKAARVAKAQAAVAEDKGAAQNAVSEEKAE
jgi:hypothetical protein